MHLELKMVHVIQQKQQNTLHGVDMHVHNYRIQQTALSFSPIKEIITDIKEMVKGMMKEFYRKNNQAKPGRILFYRDGVSEGQFQSVSVGSNNSILMLA